MNQQPLDTRWVLHSPEPEAPYLESPHEMPSWVQLIAVGPKTTFGELENCPVLRDVLPDDWECAFIPEYINPHTLVASIRSPRGKYAMLFFQKVGPDLYRQPRDGDATLIGWFHIKLVQPVVDRESLVANIRHAVSLLTSAGLINPAPIDQTREI
jgi:hypothetical protein